MLRRQRNLPSPSAIQTLGETWQGERRYGNPANLKKGEEDGGLFHIRRGGHVRGVCRAIGVARDGGRERSKQWYAASPERSAFGRLG